MLTEGSNYGISDMLKTVYPLKLRFAGVGEGVEQVTVRNLYRSTALERLVLKCWRA